MSEDAIELRERRADGREFPAGVPRLNKTGSTEKGTEMVDVIRDIVRETIDNLKSITPREWVATLEILGMMLLASYMFTVLGRS